MLLRLRKRRADGRAVVHTDILKERIYRVAKLNVRTNLDVLMHVASYLDIRSLTEWHKTSPEAELAVSNHLSHEYNKMLAKWMGDPLGFRDLLRVTGSVISGSASLRFLDRQGTPDWQAQDLDIYTPYKYAVRVVRYLMDVEGFHLDEINRPTYHIDSKGFNRVFHLSKNGRSVDVIQSVNSSALHPLPFFWGSHVITFLGADLYCLPYGRLTLQRRAVLNPIALSPLGDARPRTVACILKYRTRGYTVRRSHMEWDDLPPCAHDHEACPHTPRYFGDRLCLMGSFRAGKPPVIPAPTGRMPIWWRGGEPCDDNCRDADASGTFARPTVQTLKAADVVRLAHIR